MTNPAMTDKDLLALMRLLSALESWGFSTGTRLPDYLLDQIAESVGKLEAAILKDAT